MKKSIFVLAAILAAFVLNACSPAEGTRVNINANAKGCKVYFEAALAWENCTSVDNTGVVEDHPELGHEYAGRVRVVTRNGAYWFEPGQLTAVP